MARPRASFPDRILDEYRSGKSLAKLAAEYRSSNHTVRRWISERTMVRQQGVRL
jgi:hypothetical protein